MRGECFSICPRLITAKGFAIDFPDERKHLSNDGLVRLVRDVFREEQKEPLIALGDVLLAGFAIFVLKSASLLAFEIKWKHNTFNLRALFGMRDIPSDTQLRTILDQVDPQELRPAFTGIFLAYLLLFTRGEMRHFRFIRLF